MVRTIQAPPDQFVGAICEVLRDWGDLVLRGQIRLTPHPLDTTTYLVIAGELIVARLTVTP